MVRQASTSVPCLTKWCSQHPSVSAHCIDRWICDTLHWSWLPFRKIVLNFVGIGETVGQVSLLRRPVCALLFFRMNRGYEDSIWLSLCSGGRFYRLPVSDPVRESTTSKADGHRTLLRSGASAAGLLHLLEEPFLHVRIVSGTAFRLFSKSSFASTVISWPGASGVGKVTVYVFSTGCPSMSTLSFLASNALKNVFSDT